MTPKKGQPSDDVSSAPESGTVRGPTSGNNPSDRQNADSAAHVPDRDQRRLGKQAKDDPSTAGEEP